MEADDTDVHIGPVAPASEAGTPAPGELMEELRAEVSTLREHIGTSKTNRLGPYAYLEATLVAIAHCDPRFEARPTTVLGL